MKYFFKRFLHEWIMNAPSIWELDRQELALGTHVTKAKQFLAKISGDIRIVIPSGEGFGDQMIAVYIIEQLRALGYLGIVEVVGDLKKKIIGSHHYESPLLNILKLYQCEHLFIRDSQNITFNGFKLRFYDADYFRQNLSQLPEAELAIYTGMLHLLKIHYGALGQFSYFFTHRLTNLAKSKRALYLNPFTASSQNKMIGHIGQLKDQLPYTDYRSNALSYPLTPPSLAQVQSELSRMSQRNLPLSEPLSRIIDLSTAGNINTFPLYALHHLNNPEYALINLILGGIKANNLGQKPLLIMVMSPLSTDIWHKLEQVFQKNISSYTTLQQTINESANKTYFIDVSMNQTLPLLKNQSTYVIRLPTLPWRIFNFLSITSTYPLVYEGANNANLLKNAEPPEWGLPCPREDYVHISSGGMSRKTLVRTKVGDYFEIPAALAQAGEIICPTKTNFINDWTQFPTPDLKIAELITNYTHAKRPPLEPGNNRVAFAIAEIFEQKTCQQELDLKNCELSTVLEYPGSYFAPLLLSTACKGLGYGMLESLTSNLLRKWGYKTAKANETARFTHLLLQGALEGNALTLGVLGLEAVFIESKYHTHISQFGLTSLMFLIIWLPNLINADFKTLLTVIVLTLVFILAHTLGRGCTQMAYNKASKIRLFGAGQPSAKARDKMDEKPLSPNPLNWLHMKRG